MGFGAGFLTGIAKSAKEGFEKIDDRIADRTDVASQYHVARATREEEKFQTLADETEEGLKLLQGFFAGEPNAAELAGAVFSQYGGTLEGAKQAAEGGRLAQAMAAQEGKEVEFKSFFDFSSGAFDPDNPLSFEDVLQRQIGQFTYTPGEMVDVSPTTGFAKFLFGDVQKQIGNRVMNDLESRGINTSEPQPVERIMPSAYSKFGAQALNALKLSEINKANADVEFTIAGVALRQEEVKDYTARTKALETKMSTWTADQKANRDKIYAAIKLSGAQAAGQILDNKLLERFGTEERQVAIDVLVNEAKYRWMDDDWEEFDVRIGAEAFELSRQLSEAKDDPGTPQVAIDGLQSKLRSLEQARLKYMPFVDKARQADIISKTSPTTLWSNAIKSGFEDAQLGGVVKFDLNGQIREITEGNEFKVALAKYDVLRQFKQEYYGYGGTRQWIDANTPSILASLNNQISSKLSNIYKKRDGTWNDKGTTETVGSGRRKITRQTGGAIDYADSSQRDGTIAPYKLVQGEIYKVPYEVLVNMKGEDWVQRNLVGTKHYDEQKGFAYGVWGGGRKSDFRFFWNSERDTPTVN